MGPLAAETIHRRSRSATPLQCTLSGRSGASSAMIFVPPDDRCYSACCFDTQSIPSLLGYSLRPLPPGVGKMGQRSLAMWSR